MKTLKFILTGLLLISFFYEAAAQQKTSMDGSSIIKGVVTDNSDGKPVGFANVVLYRQKDSTMITWSITKEDGSFEFTKIPQGVFKLVASSLGFEKNTLSNVTVEKSGTTLNVDRISLSSATIGLGEITVVGEKKVIESKIDRKVINVSRDINSTGGTAIDLLKNVPNLSVNSDGSVSLRGNTDVSILIDGRPTTIDASRLDQISSSEIESIEIITSPTAKYNPEGKSGIINLRMKQKKSEGFNGNASFSAGTGDKYNAGVGLNYNFGNVNVFASYNGIYRKTESDRYLLRESYISDSEHYMQQNAFTDNNSRSNKITTGASFVLNSKNSLTASWSYNPSVRSAADSTLSQYFDRSMSLTKNIYTDNGEDITAKSGDYLLSYRKTTDKKGEEITIDFNYAGTTETMDQLQIFTLPESSESSKIFSNSKSGKSNLQSNWLLPLGKSSKLESGFQSIIRETNIDYIQNNLSGNEWIKDDKFSNIFTYNEQIHSIYSTFSGKAKELSFIAGLRLEKTYVDGRQSVNSEKIEQDYFNIYPTLNFKYSLNDNHGLKLSYGRRINRPNPRQLNPFIDKSNLEMFRSGNPNLRPEYVNAIEAGYDGKWKNANVGFTIFNNNISDLINVVTELDSAGVSHMFPENISSGRNFGLELTYEQPLSKWWKLSANGSFYRNIIKSDSTGITNSNFSYNARLNNLFTVDKKTSAQLVVIYTGPIISISSKMEPQFSVDIAIKRDLLSNKLSLTARVTDVFNTLKNSYTSWGDNFTADNWRKPETRVFYLGLLYNFGKTGTAKNTKPNMNNESVHSKEIN